MSAPADNIIDFNAYREKRALSEAVPFGAGWPQQYPLPVLASTPILASTMYGPMLFAPIVWVPYWMPADARAAGAEEI